MLQIPNVYEENCPTRMVLDHIADKWTALIPVSYTHLTLPTKA